MKLIKIESIRIPENRMIVYIKNFKDFKFMIRRIEKLSKIEEIILEVNGTLYKWDDDAVYICEKVK